MRVKIRTHHHGKSGVASSALGILPEKKEREWDAQMEVDDLERLSVIMLGKV